MVRSELREVMLQRREIDQLKNSLQEEEAKALLQQALENAENTIMDLTLQMSSVNSQLFSRKVKCTTNIRRHLWKIHSLN